jgi:hypothetical protein
VQVHLSQAKSATRRLRMPCEGNEPVAPCSPRFSLQAGSHDPVFPLFTDFWFRRNLGLIGR